MFAKGFGLTEVLLALTLSAFIITAALSCQWFARQAMQLTLEQMAASHLLIDISHSFPITPTSPALQINTASLQCPGCDQATLRQARLVQLLIQQPRVALLKDLQICHDTAAMRLSLSWRSSVRPSRPAALHCGSGIDRRQVELGGDR